MEFSPTLQHIASGAGQQRPLAVFVFVSVLVFVFLSVFVSVSGFPVLRWHQTADTGAVPNPSLPGVFMAVRNFFLSRSHGNIPFRKSFNFPFLSFGEAGEG